MHPPQKKNQVLVSSFTHITDKLVYSYQFFMKMEFSSKPKISGSYYLLSKTDIICHYICPNITLKLCNQKYENAIVQK